MGQSDVVNYEKKPKKISFQKDFEKGQQYNFFDRK